MRRLSLLLVCLAFPMLAVAQTNVEPLPDWLRAAPAAPASENTPPFGPGAPTPLPEPPPAVPVDGGLSLLALAGAGYAARRLRSRRAA